MKKIAKFFALAVGLATMLFASCSDLSDDAVVSSKTKNGDETASLTLNVTSASKLVNFSSKSDSSSRTIIPEAQEIDNLWFYLCSKNNTAGATAWSAPVVVDVKGKEVDDGNGGTTTLSREGEVIINLAKADYDFELFAVIRGAGETEAPAQSSEGTLKQAAVLVGYANADIRNDDTVNFYLTAEGLTKSGGVALSLFTDGWDIADFPDYSAIVLMSYTKATTVGTDTYTEGTTVAGTQVPADASNPTDAIALPNAAPATANYSKTVQPGTYNFEVRFTNNTKSYTWSDRIIVLPGQTTEQEIGIPLVIEKVPNAPASFNVGYIDPANTTTEYYRAEFVWDGKDADGNEINNEEKFELELLQVPAAVADDYVKTYADAVASATATAATKDAAWETFSPYATGTGANGTDVVWSTDFYGNLTVYSSGSLQKNNEVAIFKLPLGSRYVARIRATNAAGSSDWVYADLTQDIAADADIGAVAASKYTSKTISRFRVTYDLVGGTLVDSSDAAVDNVYYYCQEFASTTTSGSVTTVTGGIEIMQPDGTKDFAVTNADPAVSVTAPILTLNGSTWTNWIKGGTEYNKVKEAPLNYGGCESLLLVANYATIGTVTIFDDNDYAIGGVESASSGSGTAAIAADTNNTVYTITASQKDDVTLTWTVTYPTGVVYDKVYLDITSTDGNRKYNVGDIKSVTTDATGVTTGTFTIPISTYTKGVYNAMIKAWSAVKPNDPYTANITLTIVD